MKPISPAELRCGRAPGQGGLATLLLVVTTAALICCYVLAFSGDRVDAKAAPSGSKVPNLQNMLAVGLSSGKNLTITEEQINGYLAATLRAKQGGPLADKARLEAVRLKLVDGEVQVVLTRILFGRPHNVVLHFTVVRSTGGGSATWTVQPTGGRVGKLPVAGGLMQLVLRPAMQLAALYPVELKILRHASSLRLENGRMLVGPVEVKR